MSPIKLGGLSGFEISVFKHFNNGTFVVDVSIGDVEVKQVWIPNFPNLMDFLAKYGNLAFIEAFASRDSAQFLFGITEKWRRDNKS